MTPLEPVRLAVELSRSLPRQDVRQLATALRSGTSAVQRLSTDAAGSLVRSACHRLLGAALSAEECQLAAGAMLGSLEKDLRVSVLDVVWTGPDSGTSTGRLTSAVVVDLIDEATVDVLLIGYAVHTEPSVAAALGRAQERRVSITLLLERQVDNPNYSGTGGAFAGLPAERLAWPASERPTGASLHAKVLVVDESAALVGSANVTGAALGRNLECGLLIRGGQAPNAIRDHVRRLVERGVLRALPHVP